MIIAVDFDGTIVEHDFPRIGKEMPHAFECLKKLQNEGHKLILWTCREDRNSKQRFLSDAVDFCSSYGVEFDSINASIFNDDLEFKFSSRKPHCDLFIDDRNIEGFPGWLVVLAEIRRMENNE